MFAVIFQNMGLVAIVDCEDKSEVKGIMSNFPVHWDLKDPTIRLNYNTWANRAMMLGDLIVNNNGEIFEVTSTGVKAIEYDHSHIVPLREVEKALEYWESKRQYRIEKEDMCHV